MKYKPETPVKLKVDKTYGKTVVKAGTEGVVKKVHTPSKSYTVEFPDEGEKRVREVDLEAG